MLHDHLAELNAVAVVACVLRQRPDVRKSVLVRVREHLKNGERMPIAAIAQQ